MPSQKPTAPLTPKTQSAKEPAETGSAPASQLELARALYAEGDLQAAEREARAAIPTHGNAARLLLGQILERRGNATLAKEQYQQILASDPNNATAKLRLAKLGG